MLLEEADLVREIGRWSEDLEAQQPRDPPIHRIDRDRRRAQTGPVAEPRELPMGVEPAQQQSIGGRLTCQHLVHFGQLGGDELRRGRRGRIERPRVQRRNAGRLRVGVADPGIQPLPPEDHQDSMTLLVVELDPLHRRGQPVDHATSLLVGDPPGSPVHDVAVGVQGAEVPPGGHVTGMELDVETGGAERPASEHELEGVVSEQREMARSGARCDPRTDRLEETGHAF